MNICLKYKGDNKTENTGLCRKLMRNWSGLVIESASDCADAHYIEQKYTTIKESAITHVSRSKYDYIQNGTKAL